MSVAHYLGKPGLDGFTKLGFSLAVLALTACSDVELRGGTVTTRTSCWVRRGMMPSYESEPLGPQQPLGESSPSFPLSRSKATAPSACSQLTMW